jgi:serine/threonine protein kinase
MTEVAAGFPITDLTSFIADLLSSGAPIIRYEDVRRTRDLATGNTFTVCSGLYRDKVVAIKYFNFTAPRDIFSVVSLEVAGEILRENLANASHEIRIMTNNILRRCPNIATLEGVFFETEDPAWIRPALVMELAYDAAPTLTDLLRMPQSPLVKRSLVNNIFDGLYALHSVKICHGDVKPDNILIFSSSNDPRIPYQARVSDFGFAFVNGQTPRGSGTTGWCAPECHRESSEPLWREKAYGRDVFSAALVMRTVFDAPLTARPKIDEEQVCIQCN